MTAIHRDSPTYDMAVELADARIELHRLLDDDLFLRRAGLRQIIMNGASAVA